MNSDKILSIIVPTYNMEALLEKDLQSLVVADGLDLLEVLVINDGSKDKSSEIAHKFSSAYPDTFVVVDKPNGNYGSCINAGLKIAKGKYVKVMDADDSFDTKNFELFLKHLSQIDVDLVFNDYVKTYTSGKEINYTFDLPPMRVLKIENVYNTQAFYDILLPAITYRTEMLREMGYIQTEGISYTDTEWCFSPVTMVRSVYYINVCLYRYLMGREGQTMDPNVFSRSLPQRLKCFSSLIHSIAGKDLSPCMREFTSSQLTKHAATVYEFFLVSNPQLEKEQLKAFDNELKEYNPSTYQRCGELTYRKHINYRYVKDWRKRNWQIIPVYYRALADFLNAIGGIKVGMVKILKNKDLNEKR